MLCRGEVRAVAESGSEEKSGCSCGTTGVVAVEMESLPFIFVSSAAKFFAALSLSVGEATLLLSDISSAESRDGMPKLLRVGVLAVRAGAMVSWSGVEGS